MYHFYIKRAGILLYVHENPHDLDPSEINAFFPQQKESNVKHESKRMQPMFLLDFPDDVPHCNDPSMNSRSLTFEVGHVNSKCIVTFVHVGCLASLPIRHLATVREHGKSKLIQSYQGWVGSGDDVDCLLLIHC